MSATGVARESPAGRGFNDRQIPLLRLAFLTLTVLVVHAVMFRRLRIGGVGPDLFITLAVVAGLELGAPGGAALGMMAGVGADLVSSGPMGIWTLVCGIAGYLLGVVHESASDETIRRPPFSLIGTAAATAILVERGLAFAIAGSPFPAIPRMLLIMVIVPVWAGVLAWPLRLLLRALLTPR